MSNLLKRSSDSPFIKMVWQVHYETDGELTVTADGTWDIIFNRVGGELKCVITGPSNQTAKYLYYAGQEDLGIQFKEGMYLPGMPASEIINASRTLPTQSGVIILKGIEFEIPTYDTVEMFVDKLYQHGLLARDAVVEKTLSDGGSNFPRRSVQRHFTQSTGLPLSRHQQIARAQKAANLLRDGMAAIEVAQECGYFDQAHMNRSIKQILGVTPQQIKDGYDA
jgi:AraC-like DNA-binding protein